MKDYKIVATIEFSDGREEYVIWEPEFYGEMIYRGIDMYELFYNTSKNDFNVSPVNVLIELYETPIVKKIGYRIEGNEKIVELLVGKKIFPIRQF